MLLAVDSMEEIALYASGMLLMGYAMVLVGFPLAALAEVFEYDVVRALNKPNVLRGSRDYIGDQILTHCAFLEWGFRYSGKVISFQMVASVSVGLFATMIGAV